VRIPDLAGRPDEIGRLSVAMRGMVSALYDRIDANEQFAADVAHEIKNPLASLRSAVGTLRMTKREDQIARLLDVIEHDVRRLDRLISDTRTPRGSTANWSRREENLRSVPHADGLSRVTGAGGRGQGDRVHHRPARRADHDPGLEARLAQVFVNLIANAISFCEDGDVVRVWARKRGEPRAGGGRGYRARHPEAALDQDLQALLFRAPGKPVRQPFRPGPGDLEADRRGAWRRHLGREHPPRPTPTAGSPPLGARFVVGLPLAPLALAIDLDAAEGDRLPPRRTVSAGAAAVPLIHGAGHPALATAVVHLLRHGRAEP
jgi:two-component system, OmpR family, sensor histidine kinase ChvG